MLSFLIYDIAQARRTVSICQQAEKHKVSAEIISDHYVGSEAYWRHEQDILCDVVRIMRERHRDAVAYPQLSRLQLANNALFCPNVFITVAPGEDKVHLHEALLGRYDTNAALGDATGPVCFHIDTVFKKLLVSVLEPHFEHVYEWALRIEFQGRDTEHCHLVMWAILKADYDIVGRTGELNNPELVRALEELFGARVDVQIGNGFLNYINGYAAKASDALNFSMRDHLSKDKPSPWLTAYRMLCKRSVAVPELYHELAGLPQMVRSFATATVVAPIPGPLSEKKRSTQSSEVLYDAYLAARNGGSFLSYCRAHSIGKNGQVQARTSTRGKGTLAVGVRFHFELLDL